jgi:hypothetical protein
MSLAKVVLRRRGFWWTTLIPALLGTLLGFLVFLVVDRYWAKYTSESLSLIERQSVPENMVQPVVSDDLQARSRC